MKENLRSDLKVLNKLGARLDKTEGQIKELKGNHRTGLKGLKMSLDGVRKYYGVQRRLVEQRLLVWKGKVRVRRPDHPQMMGVAVLGRRSVAARTGFPGKLTDLTPAELVDDGERDEWGGRVGHVGAARRW